MYPGVIQLLAVALFAACLYHAWRSEGQEFAQQWFGIGYLFVLLHEILLVQLRVVSYSDRMLQFGSAPTLISLIYPAFFYIAFSVARFLTPENQVKALLLSTILLIPAITLPLDATALGFDWWSFPSQSRTFMDGVPYFMPLSWGLNGALFCGFFIVVRRIRLKGSGQLFALLLGAPLVAGMSLILVLSAQVVVTLLALFQSDLLLQVAMGILLISPPLVYAFRLPRTLVLDP